VRKAIFIMPKRLLWLSMTALGVLLISALVFLYNKTRDYDPSNYFENVALLRQIKQLDARWELDAMKSKIGINKTYDPLVDPLVDLSKLQQQLDAVGASQKGDSARTLTNSIKAFEIALQKKANLIEHFKSHNAVLRNSLTFLPTAAEDIQNLLNKGKGQDQSVLKSVAAGVNKVLLASLEYDQAAADDKVVEIELELGHLAAQTKGLPSDIDDMVGIFVAHVRTVLREHNMVSGLLNSIATAPTVARLDDINNILNGEQRRTAEQAQKYRQYLLIFAAALIGLLLYAAARLIRSHAVINHVNMELKHANDHLEQRVKQRTQELKEVQAELITTARQAGMAEIATNVLHNVGNVLNSVNVSAGLVSSQVHASKALGLGKVVELMNEHAEDLGDFLTQDQKGKMLPGYLSKLAKVVATERQSIIEELAHLTKSVDHIKDIVAAQQTYAGASSVFERFQIDDLVEDAVRISAGALSRHQVTVLKEFDDVPALLLDKHRVLQILVNLISNAKHALNGVPGRERQITLRLHRAQGDAIQIQVADNGEGIAPENLTRIFTHGFTTHKDGHGFGLHSCVLAAHEMGGSLTAHSDGFGKGATFTLELPIKAKVKEGALS